MILTPMGESFVRRASAVLSEVRRARDEVEQLHGGTRGRVVAGLSFAAHIALLPSALKPFRAGVAAANCAANREKWLIQSKCKNGAKRREQRNHNEGANRCVHIHMERAIPATVLAPCPSQHAPHRRHPLQRQLRFLAIAVLRLRAGKAAAEVAALWDWLAQRAPRQDRDAASSAPAAMWKLPA
jgi:hypothetical protein